VISDEQEAQVGLGSLDEVAGSVVRNSEVAADLTVCVLAGRRGHIAGSVRRLGG
jgi:hypothetical protein